MVLAAPDFRDRGDTLRQINMACREGPFLDHHPLKRALNGLPCSFGGRLVQVSKLSRKVLE